MPVRAPRACRSPGLATDHVHVIDSDQGRSGASTVGRDGFQHLVAEVGALVSHLPVSLRSSAWCLEGGRQAQASGRSSAGKVRTT